MTRSSMISHRPTPAVIPSEARNLSSSSLRFAAPRIVNFPFPRAKAVLSRHRFSTLLALCEHFSRKSKFPPFPSNDLQTYFSLFFTLAGISPVFATPSPQNLRGSHAAILQVRPGIRNSFPLSPMRGFPNLALACLACRTNHGSGTIECIS